MCVVVIIFTFDLTNVLICFVSVSCSVQSTNRQDRRTFRRQLWAKYISLEWTTVLAITWYLNMELIRTEQVKMTYSNLQTVSLIQNQLHSEAQRIYNEVYRDKKQSTVLLIDTGNFRLDGRIGTIEQCNYVKNGYFVVLDKPQKDQSPSKNIFVGVENLEQVHPVSVHDFNSKRKIDSYQVEIPNRLVGGQAKFNVHFRAAIFESVTKSFKFPYEQSSSAFEVMSVLISNAEKQEQVEKQKLEREQILHQQNLQKMMTRRRSRLDRPKKRLRMHTTMPSFNRCVQLCSHWKAKYDHFDKLGQLAGNNDENHLFTIPFITTDNTLFELNQDLTILRSPSLSDENQYLENFGSYEIILTQNSFDSLCPGRILSEEIVDLCLKW